VIIFLWITLKGIRFAAESRVKMRNFSFSRQEKRGNAKDYFESEKGQFYQELIQGYHDMQKLFEPFATPKATNSDKTVASLMT
jgi:thymidylate kinase